MSLWKLFGQFFKHLWDAYEYIYYWVYTKNPTPHKRGSGALAVVCILLTFVVVATVFLFYNSPSSSEEKMIWVLSLALMAPILLYLTYRERRILLKFKRLSAEQRKVYVWKVWILLVCSVLWVAFTFFLRDKMDISSRGG